eukprot:TRINITY_DN30789_c0_g1_i1.p1 TRINITY_DN30789_c0_g1~~TRINITY_DN30789_c0_g1_i1.p1  ORF type:complete len:303 (+),score=115.39 TRINITY_DN30789_c0_g1_i1:51-959(+)
MAGKAPLLYGLGCVTGGCVSYLATSWYMGGAKAKEVRAPEPGAAVSGILAKYGVPRDEHVTSVGDSFATNSNWMTRCPSWTLEHLTPEGLKGDAAREKSSFKADRDIPEPFRASPSDYKAARQLGDYVRGHMVPAADMRSNQDAMDATFILNHNVVPQDGVCNGASWFHLEAMVRKIAKKHPHTWALTGPVFKPHFDPDTGAKVVSYKLVGQHDIAVPTHLYKVIVTEAKDGGLYSAAFIVPNSPCDEPPLTYKVPQGDVERLTGLEMFASAAQSKDLCTLEKCTDKSKMFAAKKVAAPADA